MTYTPSADRILPTPQELYVKIRNTSAIPLRAAYLHGPYTLHVSCRPSTFDPNRKFEDHETEGIPQFEPHLKAGGSWDAVIPVPERIRETTLSTNKNPRPSPSLTWVIEVASEVIFSSTAAVHFEVLVGRDKKSTEIGTANLADLPAPGNLRDHTTQKSQADPSRPAGKVPGVYSESVKLHVEDTTSLWSTPEFPSWGVKNDSENLKSQAEEAEGGGVDEGASTPSGSGDGKKKRKKIHFVVLTHGLHSNLGADMLYLKENIDNAAKQAREDARKRKRENGKRMSGSHAESAGAANPKDNESDDNDDDEEQVIVRGFPGNAAKTERGIQYLGKRLAKYVQLMTYPDQPHLPDINGRTSFLSRQKSKDGNSKTTPGNASGHADRRSHDYAYEITSISFIGHSLGGLVQTYAIAYLQKHSPNFFDYIKPINFVALASPFLGLSNENPLYVKFALDFGLVGRTGQDLGLTWSAPSKVRSGWEAMIGGLGTDAQKTQRQRQPDPGAKPLLRILPNGPAHQVLKRFRNRTLYSNVVNDGIVPLRTSCLLFLDWRGLERVDKARRDNGLVGTMAEWGWAQLTGINSTSMRSGRPPTNSVNGDSHEDVNKAASPSLGPTSAPQSISNSPQLPAQGQFLNQSGTPRSPTSPPSVPSSPGQSPSSPSATGPFSGLVSLFKPQPKTHRSRKSTKIYKRSQTLHFDAPQESHSTSTSDPEHSSSKPSRMRSNSLYEEDGLNMPPKTTFLESAGNVLIPPLPDTEYLLDPALRRRTIFHDRVYHPEDIPPPPPGRPKTTFRSPSRTNTNNSTDEHFASGHPNSSPTMTSPRVGNEPFQKTSSGMRVEEKIARAYHRDLTWRKVLVQLEPDAHNNIIVRRMFANAYGWPVVKHLVDTHFGYTATAQQADELERRDDRAKPPNVAATELGEEVEDQHASPHRKASPNDTPTAANKTESNDISDENDTVPELHPSSVGHRLPTRPNTASTHTDTSTDEGSSAINPSRSVRSQTSCVSKLSQPDSAQWTDFYFEDEGDDGSEIDDNDRLNVHRDVRALHSLDPDLLGRETDSKTPSRRSSISDPGPSSSTA